MTTKTKAFIWAAVTVAALGVVALSTGRFIHDSASANAPATPPPPTVTVAQPTIRSIVEWDEYTGRFEAIDHVEVRSRVSGYLTDIAFEDGQMVQAGDLLFRVDARPFEAELAAAEADLASTSAAYETARNEAARGNRLMDRGALSEEEADRRVGGLRQAEADWAAAGARVTQAKLNLEFTEIRAPVAGRVSDAFISIGNLIVGGASGGTLLTTLVSLDPIYFEFTASEADYLKYVRLARDGSRRSGRDTQHPVRVRLMDETVFAHEGHLSFVDNQLDRSTGTIRGRATLDNPDGMFAPGMFGRLQLQGSGRYDATLIPDAAVQTDQSEKFVWVATEEDIAIARPVELGPIVDGLRVVRSGLTSTDRVIVAGTQFVQAGSPVTPEITGNQPNPR